MKQMRLQYKLNNNNNNNKIIKLKIIKNQKKMKMKKNFKKQRVK